MPENTHTQKQYDHQLRRLIQNIGDLDLAVRHGVPRSTARGWLKQSRTDVVSIDVLDIDAEALQREILSLRRHVTRFLALLKRHQHWQISEGPRRTKLISPSWSQAEYRAPHLALAIVEHHSGALAGASGNGFYLYSPAGEGR